MEDAERDRRKRRLFLGDTLWGLRGLIDRIFGGRGLEVARRSRSELRAGDTLDFWRMLQVEPPHHLQLLSEKDACFLPEY